MSQGYFSCWWFVEWYYFGYLGLYKKRVTISFQLLLFSLLRVATRTFRITYKARGMILLGSAVLEVGSWIPNGWCVGNVFSGLSCPPPGRRGLAAHRNGNKGAWNQFEGTCLWLLDCPTQFLNKKAQREMSEQHEWKFKGPFLSGCPLASRGGSSAWNTLAPGHGGPATWKDGTESEFKTNTCALTCEFKCWSNNLSKKVIPFTLDSVNIRLALLHHLSEPHPLRVIKSICNKDAIM